MARVAAAGVLVLIAAAGWFLSFQAPASSWVMLLPLTLTGSFALFLFLVTDSPSWARVWVACGVLPIVLAGILWVPLSLATLFGLLVLVAVATRINVVARIAQHTHLRPLVLSGADVASERVLLRTLARILAWGGIALAVSLFTLNLAVSARLLLNRSETVFVLALALFVLIAALAAELKGEPFPLIARLRRVARGTRTRGRT
jgi:hypothetical protein